MAQVELVASSGRVTAMRWLLQEKDLDEDVSATVLVAAAAGHQIPMLAFLQQSSSVRLVWDKLEDACTAAAREGSLKALQ